MATEVGDIIEFIVGVGLLQQLMYDDESLAIEDPDTQLQVGVDVEEITPENGQLLVRGKVSWIEEETI